MSLHVAPSFDLPLEAVTETLAILAVKRAGKSNAAVVIAEEMYDAGVPWVAIDPKGDWWGVRAGGDGNSPGLSVLVFGGLHGDVPLEPTAGRLVADLIVEQRLTCVLDVSEMSRADQRRFLIDFADRLYRRNTEPLHVFCEEADEYIPQRVTGETAKLVGAFETLVKRGGFRGIGITLITQRSASLNKDVLTQVGTLIAMRTPSPQDRKAVLAWIDYHAASHEVIDQLPTLDAGEAWVFSPQWLATLTRIRFRRRRTFDSGATPKVGGKPRPPARLADVDLAAIKEAMAETIERAKADDPRELRKRIRELEQHRCPEPATVEPERVEVPVLTDDDRLLIEEFLRRWDDAYDQATDIVNRLRDALAKAGAEHGRQDVPRTRAARHSADPVERPRPAQRPDPPRRQEPRRAAVPRPTPTGGLTGPQQRVLDALAWLDAVGFPQPTKLQVGFIAGYRVGKKIGGTFGNILGELRSAGLIEYPSAGTARLTGDGRQLATPADIEPTTDGLQQAVYGRLTEPERRVLQGIVAAYPDPISKQDAGEQAGYTVGPKVGGTFGNILGRLRSLGLIDYPAAGEVVACDVLFLGGR